MCSAPFLVSLYYIPNMCSSVKWISPRRQHLDLLIYAPMNETHTLTRTSEALSRSRRSLPTLVWLYLPCFDCNQFLHSWATSELMRAKQTAGQAEGTLFVGRQKLLAFAGVFLPHTTPPTFVFFLSVFLVDVLTPPAVQSFTGRYPSGGGGQFLRVFLVRIFYSFTLFPLYFFRLESYWEIDEHARN